MAIQTRSSVMAVVVESTEGTPVAPTSAGQYLAMQDDATITPAFEVLENAEMKASIGKSKSILGAEAPSGSMSHYLKHSGTEGVAPEIDELLTAAFGTEVIASTEYDTIAASTVSVVKVDAGEGANFQRGQGLLIKDGTNGYAIRPVHSVSTDDLTIGFDLANAPGTGVNLGKAVLYKPANSGHQALSIWNYIGNGGATQMMTGARITEFGFSAEAGQLVNSNFSFEGIGYYFNPIEITASTKYIDWTDDDGTHAAQVTVKTYKDPHQLADALATAMNDQTADTITVTYSDSTGKFTIACGTTAVLTLKWQTGANTANTIGTKLGFSVAADDSAALTYTSDNAISFAAPQTPSYDSADPLAAKSNSVLLGDSNDNVCFGASSISFTMSTPKTDIQSICSDSGKSGSIINSREVTVGISALLEQYDADKFRRFRENTETRFMYGFGEKSGGNWVAGKCACLYMPTATITAFNIVDADGLVQLDMELKAFVDSSGNGEVYLSFL